MRDHSYFENRTEKGAITRSSRLQMPPRRNDYDSDEPRMAFSLFPGAAPRHDDWFPHQNSAFSTSDIAPE
jgi:hypothetical protein